MTDLAGLLLFLAVMTGTPGPANLLLLSASTRYGARATLGFLLGVVTGFQIIVWPIGFGLMALAAQWPTAYTLLQWLCAAYIVWLAWHIARSRLGRAGAAAQDAPGFARGLLVHPLNPKAWVIATGAFTQFVPPAADALVATAVVSATSLGVGLLLQGLWLASGNGVARLAADPRAERGLMHTLGLLTVASVAWALW